MPKGTEYKIVWSHEQKAYEVMHTPFSFLLMDTGTLHYWLKLVDAVSFTSREGYNLTLRKEKKPRGGSYWYAYKRVNGVLHKRYIGHISKLDLSTLETLARHFIEPEPAPPRKPMLTFTRSLPSALHIYGFTSLPTRKALIMRYRELSKQHHPDTGGVHEDMVAINLAYDYLKKRTGS